MKGDYRQPAARLEHPHCRRESFLKHFKLAIDGDPECLEGLCGRVDWIARAPRHLATKSAVHHSLKMRSGDNRAFLTCFNYAAGYATRSLLFSVFVYQVGKLYFGQSVHQVCGG